MNKRKKFILHVSFCAVLFVAGSAVAKDYAIPGHGNLQLETPKDWRVSSRATKQPPSVVLQAKPESGEAFNLQVTTVWLDSAALAKTTPQSIQEDVQKSGKQLLAQAEERTLNVRELRGPQTVGYYYGLTDRAPAPGEFKFMIQGIALSGQALTTFTILFRAPNTPEVDRALQVLAAATYSEK